MFGMHSSFIDETRKVEQAAEKAAFRNFAHAGASIRKDIRASIETKNKVFGGGQDASPAGQPPRTRRGRFRAATKFAADEDSAVIGLEHSIAGTAGEPHEHGGNYKGGQYPERPMAFPALLRAIPRFGDDWHMSIGEG